MLLNIMAGGTPEQATMTHHGHLKLPQLEQVSERLSFSDALKCRHCHETDRLNDGHAADLPAATPAQHVVISR